MTHSQFKTILYVVAANLVDLTFFTFCLQFGKTIAIIPTEFKTSRTIEFKITPPDPEIMLPADKRVMQKKRFRVVS